MPGIIWSPLNGGNQQSIIKGPREYEGYYVLVAWWREKERRCWDFIESMSISKGDKQTHGNAEKKLKRKLGKYLNSMYVFERSTYGSHDYWTFLILILGWWSPDWCGYLCTGNTTTKILSNYMVFAFHFYFYQSSPFIQKELIKPWVSSELGAGPVYGRGGERTGELCSWQMAHNGGRQRTWIHFGWLWISQVQTFNVE